MKFDQVSPNLDRNRDILTPKIVGRKEYSKNFKTLQESDKILIRNEIEKYYFSENWGLKLLARNVLGISYSNCRSTFTMLGLQFNTGIVKCSEHLREFRRQRALVEDNLKIGINFDGTHTKAISTRRGVQGYYYNKSTDSYVWLRSTYEFIYAKFLNKIGVNWKTEQTYFTLSDGKRYSPDFYIYSKDWALEKIVEIKGYWDNHAYKPGLLKTDYFSKSTVEIILIRDIKTYIEENLTYNKELETWKTIRKSKDSLLKASS